MTTTTKYPWIIIKYDVNPNIMICERCKKEQSFPEGTMSINFMIGIMDLFAKIHKKCKIRK